MTEHSIELKKGKNFLSFEINDGRVYLTELNGKRLLYAKKRSARHSTVVLFGAERFDDGGSRYGGVGEDLYYRSHGISEDRDKLSCEIVEENKKIRVITEYTLYSAAECVSVKKTVENISQERFYLEFCSSFNLYGLFDFNQKIYVYKPYNSHYNECAWRKTDIADEGVFELIRGVPGTKRFYASNAGSQSSKNILPMGMLESNGELAFWEIESDSLWHYETGLISGVGLYASFGGGAFVTSGFIKGIEPSSCYSTPTVRLTIGKSVDEVVKNATDLRRITHVGEIKHPNAVIYNEYMHFAWDKPNEVNTRIAADKAAELGVDYYVIDADWHDEIYEEDDCNRLEECEASGTHMIGGWKESSLRYPSGLNKTLEYIRSKGLKVGLWVELQSVGVKVENFPLGDDCFFTFKGKKITRAWRYQLDYRNVKVRNWASQTLERIITQYSPDYIKIDYNQSVFGSDYNSDSLAEALEEHNRCYIEWFSSVIKKYPQIVFESCASGGQSINSANTCLCDLMSTSDMTSYIGYAYISANIGSAILPEQSGVWCYPQINECEPTAEEVIMNMVNAAFHRLQLSGKIHLLSQKNEQIVKEGLAYYKSLDRCRLKCYPIFPSGFARAEDKTVVSGIKYKDRLFIAVYKLEDNEREVTVDLSSYGTGEAKISFPLGVPTKLRQAGSAVTISFGKGACARIFEYKIKNRQDLL